MRTISYRTKQRLRKTLKITLIVLAAIALLLGILLIYLQRYVVYTADGIRIDFDRSTAVEFPAAQPQPAQQDELPEVSIVYGDPNSQKEKEALSGYYIDYSMLKQPERALETVKSLETPCTILIDLKSGNGSFYYTSSIDGAKPANVDLELLDELLSYLKTHGFSMIARIKAFEDTAFAEAHPESGLKNTYGDLWVGDSNYWLQPDSETVRSYLKQIARELAGKGFREIVFDDFYFPEGSKLVYSSEKTRPELIADTAQEFLNFFASSNITISFGNPSYDFVVEDSHIFVSGIDGTGINTTVSGFSKLTDPVMQLVFLTSSRDTRFEGYQVLRPLF